MTLEGQRRDWETLAETDPLWAVLTDPARKGGRWEPEEFLATGEAELAGVLASVEGLGLPASGRAFLDFGCGAGRITRAAAGRFERAVGVDIAVGMVETARRLNADRPNAEFVVNARPDLSLFEDGEFDLAYSTIVLQHQPSRELAAGYLRELARVVRPGGGLVFQLPTETSPLHRLELSRRVYALARRLGVSGEWLIRRTPFTPMRMISLPEADVRAVLDAAGAEVVRVEPLGPAGARYFARRQAVAISWGLTPDMSER
jgi:SAM-dependent methyltransferase